MKKWMRKEPHECDICHTSLDKVEFFVDGKVGTTGPWALMCLTCYINHGLGIGIGVGQLYSGKTLEKIRG